jgi:hypothetical protein
MKLSAATGRNNPDQFGAAWQLARRKRSGERDGFNSSVTPCPSWSVFDHDLEAVLGFLEVGNVERHALGPPKRPCEVQQQQRAVAEALEALGAIKAMARACSARPGALRAGAAPTARRMPRSVARTCSELVGGSRSARRWA